MSFLNDILHKAEKGLKSAITFFSSDFVDGFASVIALSSMADGLLDQNEMSRIRNVLTSSDSFKNLDHSKVLERISHFCEKLKNDPSLGRIDCESALLKIKDNLDEVKQVISWAIIICQGGNDYGQKEIKELVTICKLLGQDPNNFGLKPETKSSNFNF